MTYTITVKFDADRELTEYEKEMLLGSIELQIQEPQNYDGDDLEWGATVEEISIKGEGK